MSSSKSEMVRDYLSRGWQLTTVNGKVATRKQWQAEPPLTESAMLAWPHNIALRTGSGSGVYIIDGDEGSDIAALNLPATVQAVTGGGGMHYFFRIEEPLKNSVGGAPGSPESKRKRRLGDYIDTRGDGGYAVLPPSIHPETGAEYEWAEGRAPWEIEMAPLPEWIAEIMRPEPEPEPSSEPLPRASVGEDVAIGGVAHTVKYASKVFDDEIERVRNSAGTRTRNDTLNRASYSLGTLVASGLLDRTACEQGLYDAAISVGLVAKAARATIASGIGSGEKKPRDLNRVKPLEKTATRTRTRRAVATTSDEPQQPPSSTPDVAPPEFMHIDSSDAPYGIYTDHMGRKFKKVLQAGTHEDSQSTYLRIGINDFCNDILRLLPNDRIYRRGDLPGELLSTADGTKQWRPLTNERTRSMIESHICIQKWFWKKDPETKDDRFVEMPVVCTNDMAGLIRGFAADSSNARELKMITPYPIFTPEWKIQAPGYDASTQVYYDETRILEGVRPERDLDVIKATLEDLVVDFPFDCLASKYNFFGLLVTPLILPALKKHIRPCHHISGSRPGSAKTKLAGTVFGGIILGEPASNFQVGKNEEEMEKRIMSLLAGDKTIVNLDNLPRHFESHSFASLITSIKYQGRLLGQSFSPELPNSVTFVSTGNNVRFSEELARRMVPIRLTPKHTLRNPPKYKHTNLDLYVEQVRPKVISCLLGWVEISRERGDLHSGTIDFGFGEWSRPIHGLMKTLGGADHWMGNYESESVQADADTAEIEKFATLWWNERQSRPTTATKLLEIIKGSDILGWLIQKDDKDNKERSYTTKVGTFVTGLRGRVVETQAGNLQFTQEFNSHEKAFNYWLECLDNAPVELTTVEVETGGEADGLKRNVEDTDWEYYIPGPDAESELPF